MKKTLTFAVLALGPLLRLTWALDPTAIGPLIKGAEYTFTQICQFHNPDPFFQESVSLLSILYVLFSRSDCSVDLQSG